MDTSLLPKTLIARLKPMLGDEWDAFIEALRQPPVSSLRVNPMKGPDLFANEEAVPWCKYGRYPAVRPKYVWDPLYHAGAYYAQEAASMIFANAIDFSKDLKVLDLCAAPGGKSTLLLSFLSENSLLVSNELVGKRASILYENIVKWGAPNVVITNNNVSDFHGFRGFFDVVLIDAPCSGEGMFRKDDEVITQWSEGLVEQCSIIQKNILSEAVGLIKPGGLLIYSTCTWEGRENEDNIEWLYNEFDVSPATIPIKPEWGVMQKELNLDGQIQPIYYCFPHRVKGEGQFIATVRIEGNEHASAKPQKGGAQFQKLSAAEESHVGPYLRNDKITLKKFQDGVIAIPLGLEHDMAALAKNLRIKKAGAEAGVLAKNQLIPHHDLLMCGLAAKDIQRVALDQPEALDYLQRKMVDIDLAGIKKGWFIFTYKGLDIGWAKNLGNRYNNHYPQEWRIRKEPTEAFLGGII